MHVNTSQRVSAARNQPARRVFERLGLSFQHRRWKDYDLYWADEGNEAIVEALERWNQAHTLEKK